MIIDCFGEQLDSQYPQIHVVDQDNDVTSDDKNLSKEFSNFFDTAVKNLDMKDLTCLLLMKTLILLILP